MKADIFYRSFNRHATLAERVRSFKIEVPETATLDEMVDEASNVSGLSMRSKTGDKGIFEIQTDFGIWAHWGDELQTRPLLTGAPTFKTWEELDNEPC